VAFVVICEDDQDAPVTVGPVATEDRAIALKGQIEYELGWGVRGTTRLVSMAQARREKQRRQA